MLALRSSPTFVRVWLGQLISQVGDGMYFVAVAWWVKTSTGSDALLTAIALSSALPIVLFGPVGGILADRLNRWWLMLTTDIVRGALLLVPAALEHAGRLEVWHLGVTAVGLAICSALFGPAWGASLVHLVPSAQLTAANAANQTFRALASVVGPALGGVAIATLGMRDVILVNAVTFGVAALLLAVSRVPQPTARRSGGRPTQARDLREVWVFFQERRLVTGLALMFAALNFLWAAFALLPSYGRDVLHLSSSGYGVLAGALPLGVMLGGIWMAGARLRAVGPFILGAVICAGLLYAALGFTSHVALAGALLVLQGMAIAVLDVNVMVVYQRRIPPTLQGRAFGLLGTLGGGLAPLGLMLFGLASERWGVAALFATCGLLMMSVGVCAAGLVPGLMMVRGVDEGKDEAGAQVSSVEA